MLTKTMLVEPKVWRSSQAWHFESVWKVGNWVVRIQIERDAYDSQSYLRAEILTLNGWAPLIWRPMTKKLAGCYAVTYVRDNVKADDFGGDQTSLVEEAAVLLAAMEGRAP